MTEKEYEECRYIENDMSFITYEDFVKHCYVIKRMYQNLKYKVFYKWYVYSHEMHKKKKDKIWEFLNGDETKESLMKYCNLTK